MHKYTYLIHSSINKYNKAESQTRASEINHSKVDKPKRNTQKGGGAN